ncbi:hypothetical protein [Haloplasma contractile]|uniref:Uncharacterized protein n=1 Tax=Haloplasma contractile SSD-17B TaxID=1033810 RepID=U2FMA5_9MOLU|nr:hypothetical protein [Haloplasma contractile]ERJ12304.1 hypothetical protein HLPCO_001831 [Haloplasma contractile SSD-17B]
MNQIELIENVLSSVGIEVKYDDVYQMIQNEISKKEKKGKEEQVTILIYPNYFIEFSVQVEPTVEIKTIGLKNHEIIFNTKKKIDHSTIESIKTKILSQKDELTSFIDEKKKERFSESKEFNDIMKQALDCGLAKPLEESWHYYPDASIDDETAKKIISGHNNKLEI